MRDQNGRIVQMRDISDAMTTGRVDQILTTPLFGLESARDFITTQALARYTSMAVRDDLDTDEEEQLRKDAAFLKVRLPSPIERDRSRRAFSLIREALDEQLRRIPEQELKGLVEEVELQIQESISGSRRPE
jgi:hypothetical protein